MTSEQTSIKAKAFMLSNGFNVYAFGVYLGSIWFIMLALIPLTHLFPRLNVYGWIVIVPYMMLPILIMFVGILVPFSKVFIDSDTVTLKWLGTTVKKLSVSRIQLFCAVGNEREDVLCFSCYTIAELAELQEKRLLKNPLEKYNVPLRKKRGDWQDVFTKEYLNYLRGNSFRLIREPNVIMLEMKPVLQYVIRRMYPQIPYKNYTEVTSRYLPRFSLERENEAVCFGGLVYSGLYGYKVNMEPDGIHIFADKNEKIWIPAQEIKTAVRVDVFKKYDKYDPHHMPLLLITSLSEEELVSRAANSKVISAYSQEKDNQALLAMIAATDMTMRWTIKKKDSCIMHHTQQNVEKLRELYPHIQFNEIAAGWITDSLE